jgi:hypothetical protein
LKNPLDIFKFWSFCAKKELDFAIKILYNDFYHEECVRDKLADRTATWFPIGIKVLKLDRWPIPSMYGSVGSDGAFSVFARSLQDLYDFCYSGRFFHPWHIPALT